MTTPPTGFRVVPDEEKPAATKTASSPPAGFTVIKPQIAPAEPERPGFGGSFARGFKRVLPETGQFIGAGTAALGSAIGSDTLRDVGTDAYKRWRDQTAPLEGPSFKDVREGKAGVGEYVGDVLGNFAGQALESAAAAGVGAIAGSEVPGLGTAAGAVGGLVARGGVKKAITAQAEKILADRLAQGATKEAAEAAAKTATNTTLQRLGGAAAGGYLQNAGQEVGVTHAARLDAEEQGTPITQQDALKSIGAGAIAGGVDTLAEGLNVGRILRGASTSPNVFKRVTAGVGAGAVTEGATEGVQAAIERAGSDRPLTGDEANQDYIENVVAGAIGGGVLGGSAGIRRVKPAIEEPRAAVPYPEAAPGSLSDAANVVSEAKVRAERPKQSGPAPQAGVANPPSSTQEQLELPAQVAPTPKTQTAARSTKADGQTVAPVQAPWINVETGEVSAATPEQIMAVMGQQLRAQLAADGSVRISSPALAKAWGVPAADIKRARAAMLQLSDAARRVGSPDPLAVQAPASQGEADAQAQQIAPVDRGVAPPVDDSNSLTAAGDDLVRHGADRHMAGIRAEQAAAEQADRDGKEGSRAKSDLLGAQGGEVPVGHAGAGVQRGDMGRGLGQEPEPWRGVGDGQSGPVPAALTSADISRVHGVPPAPSAGAGNLTDEQASAADLLGDDARPPADGGGNTSPLASANTRGAGAAEIPLGDQSSSGTDFAGGRPEESAGGRGGVRQTYGPGGSSVRRDAAPDVAGLPEPQSINEVQADEPSAIGAPQPSGVAEPQPVAQADEEVANASEIQPAAAPSPGAPAAAGQPSTAGAPAVGVPNGDRGVARDEPGAAAYPSGAVGSGTATVSAPRGKPVKAKTQDGDALLAFTTARGNSVTVREVDFNDPSKPAMYLYNSAGARVSGGTGSVLRRDLRDARGLKKEVSRETPSTDIPSTEQENAPPQGATDARAPQGDGDQALGDVVERGARQDGGGILPATDAVTDRRSDTETRARLDALPPDERDAEIATLRADKARLERELQTDSLTGLLNQRAWKERPRKPNIALIDLDLFKGYNDLLGYDGADQALRAFGQAIAEANPGGDNYRFGGDEFAMGADTPEQLQQAVAALDEASNRIQIELIGSTGKSLVVRGVPHSVGVGTDEATANVDLKRAKSGKPDSRSGAQPSNITEPVRAAEPAVEAVPAAEPEREGAGESAAEVSVETASAEAATSPDNDKPEPTEAQKEAGNYAKGHLRINGLDISIENPAGTRRRPEWPPLKQAYGYIRRTEGNDGDHLDVFLGPNATDTSLPVFVIDQRQGDTNRFDEHKVVMGFATGREARNAYESNYTKGWKGFGGLTQMSQEEFKQWALSGDLTKPAAGKLSASSAPANPSILFAKPDVASKPKNDKARVQAVVAKATEKWGDNQPQVRVVETADDLPVLAKNDPGFNKTVEGFYDGKVIYLVAANLSDRRIEQVLAHEAVGHYGVDRILNDATSGGWDKLAADIKRIRDEKLGSARMQAVIREVARRYPDASDRTFAQEVVAVMAEKGVSNGILSRVVAALRAFLRKIMPGLQFNEVDLRRLLAKSENFLRSNVAKQTSAAPAFAQQMRNADPFYSALQRSVEQAKGAPKSGTSKQWKEWLDGAQRRGEFKGAERDWLGIDQWLDDQPGNVSRVDVGAFVAQNSVRIIDRVLENTASLNGAEQARLDSLASRNYPDLSEAERDEFDALNDRALNSERVYELGIEDDVGAPKFPQYVLPGGGGYRELLMTLPAQKPPLSFEEFRANRPAITEDRARELYADWQSGKVTLVEDSTINFDSSHFDVPNILTHIRFNERVAADGAPTLHIEEIQSDWHQKGRRSGYHDPSAPKFEVFKAKDGEVVAGFESEESAKAEANRLGGEYDYGPYDHDRVPDAPLKQTDDWALLGFKRALRWAAENGFERVTWTTGAQQADRYDLRKQIGELVYWRDGKEWGVSASSPTGDSLFEQRYIKDDDLDSELGKEVADKMRAGEGESNSKFGYNMGGGEKALRGENLAVGGSGMKSFYDQMLPKAVSKYVKKWGASVGTTQIETGQNELTKSGDLVPEKVTVHSVDVTPAMQSSVLEGQPLFSKPGSSVDSIDAILARPDEGIWSRAKEWAKGAWQDLRPTLLGGLTLNHLLELSKPLITGAGRYSDIVQRMGAERNQLQEEYGAIGTKAADWARKNKPEAKRLSDLMNDSTINGTDPSKPYEPLKIRDARGDFITATRQAVAERIKAIRGQMRGRPGETHLDKLEELKQLQQTMPREKRRKSAYPGLVARYTQLSDQAKSIFGEFRDTYQLQSDRVEEALQKRIDALDAAENYKRAMKEQIRQQFEEARLQGVYFPLTRNGDYWISAKDSDGESVFTMFENFRDFDRAQKTLKDRGYTIEASGRRDSNYRAKDAPSGTFVADIIEQLKKAKVRESIQDEIYQLYLKTLPELSMRKHSIHRKKVAGFESDHIRAFAKNMFHGAHQLARLRYAHELQGMMEAMKVSAQERRKAGDMTPEQANATDALLGELQKRHDWIMSPKDSSAANIASAIGFIYYLGLTPASAVVNMTQGALTTFPVLGAKFGFDKATRALSAATRDAVKTWGNIGRTLTSEEEKTAYNVLQQRGDIQKTQTYNLAAIGEGDKFRTNPTWAKIMEATGYLFQKMEVINREAAGMAAFRLARSSGDTFESAINYASEVIQETHFDYSNANRARFMQSGPAKVLLMFRQYALNMSWLIGRNVYQSFKGESPEVRKEARRTTAGILGMSALLSGAMGLPFMGIATTVMNALQAAFGDDDEPYDAAVEIRNRLAEMLGPEAASWIASGAVNKLGADVASRVSLNGLWFRDADRELEGQDAYYNLLEQAAGPMGGIVKNVLVGKQQMDDGHLWRGVETMMPKAIKDAMKSLRFATQGANTLRGDPLIEDVSAGEKITQALGFSPTRLSEQYRVNRAVKNYEQHILDRRASLLSAMALAVRMQDGEMRAATLESIRRFNEKYPELALNARSIRQSLRARQRYSAQAENGIVLNKRIAARAREEAGGFSTQ